MAVTSKPPLSDVSDMYLNMKMESAQKRLAYQESVWSVKEIDFIEDKRKLELRIALQERELEILQREVAEASKQANGKVDSMQGRMKMLAEEKEIMHRELLSLQKQLDYYKVRSSLRSLQKGETESLQKKMKDANDTLSEVLNLRRQVVGLQTELENEKRATARTSKNASENRDSEKSLQKEITELKAQLTKQTQLTEKAKTETLKVKEDWEKQKAVLEAKLDKEKAKNKTIQEKKTSLKRKASDDAVVPSLLSPIKPSPVPATRTVSITAPAPAVRKPVAKKAQPVVSEFSTTPFFARQGSAIPQPSPSLAANTSIMGRAMPVFGGSKSKRTASAMKTTAQPEEVTEPTLEEDTSLGDMSANISANTSVLTDMGGIPKKKKRKLNGGTGNRTLLAVPDESPAHGMTEFGVSALMMESPATRPKFGGNHLLSTVKKPKGGLLWNLKKGGLKMGGVGSGLISPEKGSDKMKDIKKGFTLKL